MKMTKKKIIIAAILGVILFIQFIPVELSNPVEHNEPNWDSPKTREYFFRACADCHSNRVEFPFYSKIAPFSWLIAYDVNEGRRHFNISDNNISEGNEASREVSKEAMPLPIYSLMHPKARFTKEETAEFIRGLESTFGKKDEELQRERWGR